MSDFFKTPDFSNFGIIDNSISPVPEAFLIKELAVQNCLNNLFVEILFPFLYNYKRGKRI